MKTTYVVHYAEIGLKGRNRASFEKKLIENIAQTYSISKSWRLPGRIVLRSEEPLDLSTVFGVAWWALVDRTPSSVEDIGKKAIEKTRQNYPSPNSFAVRAKVADKRFELNSQELEVEIGRRVQDATGLDVDLTHPDLTLFIEITHSGALVFTEKKKGPGGLPVGISGKVMGLFSGGMDSAVACYMMAKRGCGVELVHFYAMPEAREAHKTKIGGMARSLQAYSATLVIHYVPYHHFQLATTKLPKMLRRHELVVFRRFMARAAEQLAHEHRATALFSGDNLGQVASQTLENLIAVDHAISMPMFRPVIGYDKIEIVNLAKRIGLFEQSIVAYKDCCSMISKHPATRAKYDVIETIEAEIGAEKLLSKTLSETESIEPKH
ncbi:MAG: tRNA uracil 4-sulfurtransferase ThiI [Anaerolineales bacterium]|jgi:thiamine biosynthesis protein ThiI